MSPSAKENFARIGRGQIYPASTSSNPPFKILQTIKSVNTDICTTNFESTNLVNHESLPCEGSKNKKISQPYLCHVIIILVAIHLIIILVAIHVIIILVAILLL